MALPVQARRVQFLDVEGSPDTLRRAGCREAHRAHPRVRTVAGTTSQSWAAGEEVQGVRHWPAGVVSLEREGAGGCRQGAIIWMEQASNFLREIVKEPAVLVGKQVQPLPAPHGRGAGAGQRRPGRMITTNSTKL
jgi:hypothetical protein